jgi:predicted RNA-binding Zn ribbon-like protein
VVSDEKGLLEFNAYETHRRGVDKFVESLKTRPGLLLAPIAPAHARYLIGAALERNVKSGTRVPSGASEMRPYWDAGEESSAPLPEDALQTIESDETGSALATSAKLLENEAFKGWFVDPDLVSPFVERTREAESSKIVLNQLQRRERTAGLIREATDEIFAASEPDSLRDRYGQRLWRMAYLLSVRGDSVGAKQAKAVAERLRDRATQSSLTPFLYAIVEKTVQVLTRDEEEKEKKTRDEEGPSLIVKP